MKFSAVLIASLAAGATAFAPSSRAPASTSFSAATLEAPAVEAAEAVAAPAEEVEEKDFPVAENFVKDSDRVIPGRYNDLENSIALPFLPRPSALDGSHAGDYGFDPLGLSEKLDFYSMQEAEIRHSRLAMLAVVGWPMSEMLAPSWMLQNGCAPSVLNGVNPLSAIAILGFLGAAGYFELKTALRMNETPMGNLHRKDNSAVWKYGVAGDYNWDPLNLYSSCGDDYKGRKGLRDVELSHGRMAMLGITSFAAWEALTGHPIVENSMLFHPNALFPALVLGYTAWSQIYEVTPLDQYPIGIQYTSEGEMKMERLQRGISDTVAQISDKASASKTQLDKVDEMFGIYSAPGKAVKAVKGTYKYWDEGGT